MVEWSDETAYGSMREIGQPRVYVAIIYGFRLSVHRSAAHDGVWMFSCYEIQLENERLDSPDINEAKKQAIKLFVKTALDKASELQDAAKIAARIGESNDI